MSNQAPLQSPRSCAHIKTDGQRCQAPPLRGEQFCYFHQRMHRTVRIPPSARIHPIANLEDEQAIQASLMEVMNAIVRNTIDIRRAELLIRALNAAARNARRTRFGDFTEDMVRQIPDYPAPAQPQATQSEETDANQPERNQFDLPFSAYAPTNGASNSEPRSYKKLRHHPQPTSHKMTSEELIANYFGTPAPDVATVDVGTVDGETEAFAEVPAPVENDPFRPAKRSEAPEPSANTATHVHTNASVDKASVGTASVGTGTPARPGGAAAAPPRKPPTSAGEPTQAKAKANKARAG